MNIKILTGALIALLAGAVVRAQPFNSGSDGSYGAMNITSNTTLTVPANGIFNCTTISVSAGATLTFNKNALNTPVYLLATGDVAIDGAINVSGTSAAGFSPGLGGPGGFDGGYGGFGIGDNGIGGDGQGPGGGFGVVFQWDAVFGSRTGSPNTNLYGNALLVPLIGGSGGGADSGNPGLGGGGGGGALLIGSNTKIAVSGLIQSLGGNGRGGGSGGAIRLVAPIVTGGGRLSVTGGGGYFSGGPGRIRIDCQDRYAFRSLIFTGNATRGAEMYVFPATVPRLDVVEAAGQAIPVGTGSTVQIDLPAGSTTNRTVRVQGRDFTGIVPITVAVVPENRPSSRYNSQIDMSAGNPAEVTVNVVIPDGTISRVHVWTR